MSGEGKHTPEPWGVRGLDVQATVDIMAAGRFIATIHPLDDGIDNVACRKEAAANATLIAAAPDLLAALEDIKNIVANPQEFKNTGRELQAILDKARPAIKKAKEEA